MEVDLHRNLYGNRLSVLLSGLKLPRFHSFDSFGVEACPKRAQNVDILRMPIFVHYQPHRHHALILCLPRGVGEFGFLLIQDPWGSYTFTDFERSIVRSYAARR